MKLEALISRAGDGHLLRKLLLAGKVDYLNVVLFQFGQDVGLEALQLGRGQRVGLGDHRHQIHFFVQLPHGHHVQHAQSVRRFFFIIFNTSLVPVRQMFLKTWENTKQRR